MVNSSKLESSSDNEYDTLVQLKQTDLNARVLALVALVYYVENDSQSSINSIPITYQKSRDDLHKTIKVKK